MASSLTYLKQAGILTSNNRNIVAKYSQLSQFESILSCLKTAKILNQNNFAIITKHANLEILLEVLNDLATARILNQENFEFVATKNNTANLASALIRLHEAKMLTPKNQEHVVNHAHPEHLASALIRLHEAKMLTPKNQEHVVNHAHPEHLASALIRLHEAEMLTPKNQEHVVNHAHPEYLASALIRLHEAEMLTPENQEHVVNHDHPEYLASALIRLHKAAILTSDNRALVVNHAHPENLASALIRLHKAKILTLENKTVVANHPTLYHLALALFNLQQAKILNQENFDALIAPNHAFLVDIRSQFTIWGHIPRQLLTQDNFQKLLTASEHNVPLQEVMRVRNQILGIELEEELPDEPFTAPTEFNSRQSTHSASVHESASQSAIRLQRSYGNTFDLREKIKEIKTDIHQLDETSKHQAAKQSIARITNTLLASFTDEKSGVSILQLLALTYVAIHDESKRKDVSGTTVALEDAKSLFIEGLIEMQIGNTPVGEDEPICPGGIFNKLMEKLTGIHQDVNVYYITHQGAYLKFPILVLAHANDYLQSIASPKNAAEYQKVKALLDELKSDATIKSIWNNIKEQIKEELWDEFKIAYSHNQNDKRFMNIISHGHESNIPNLDKIEAVLEASPGFQDYITQQQNIKRQEMSLWAKSESDSKTHKQNNLTHTP